MGSYYERLIKKVLDLSNSKEWDLAVKEWYIDGCEENEVLEASCVCGKENLRYLFLIVNSKNGNTLYPIGSSCIKKFDRSDLNEIAKTYEKLFRLFHAVEVNDFITLKQEYFSRRIIKYLYEEGAFLPNPYNHNNPENDYKFLLEMYNKRNKNDITIRQKNKISAIIVVSIRPYLAKKIKLLEKKYSKSIS